VAAAIGKTFGKVYVKGHDPNVINDPNTIVSVSCDDYIVKITFVKGAPWSLVMSLGEIMIQLDPAIFYQCHQSHIVNANFVSARHRNLRGLLLKMTVGDDIPVSVSETDSFKAFIDPFLNNNK
jgi:DNA-binding LytR/AlgR family response regulator